MTKFNMNFLLLFFGRLVSRLGDSIFTIGVAWYILELTGSAVQMGSFVAVMIFTMVLAGPVGGNVVDQFNKVKLLYWMDFIRGFVVVTTALTILSGNRTLIIGVLYALAVISALCTAVFNPASSALIPMVVSKDELVKANSMMAITGSITNIVGLLLGGALYGLIGPFGVILLDGTSYLLSGISELFIKVNETRNRDKTGHKSLKDQLNIFKEGLGYLNFNRSLIYIGLFATVLNFSVTPTFQVYQPYLIKVTLSQKIIVLTVINIISSLGMLFGGIGMSFIGTYVNRIGIINFLRRLSVTLVILFAGISFVVFSAVQFGVPFHVFIVMYCIVVFAVGIVVSAINIPIETFIQKNTDISMMGRVNSVISMLSMVAMPFGLILGGVLVDAFSVEYAYIVSMIILALACMKLLFRSDFTEFGSGEEQVKSKTETAVETYQES